MVRFDSARAEDSFPGAEWEHAAPADLGWSEPGLAQARAFSDAIRSSAVVIVQHGRWWPRGATRPNRPNSRRPASGTWTVVDGRVCINGVQRRCYIPVLNGDRIALFDQLGVMQIDAVAQPQ